MSTPGYVAVAVRGIAIPVKPTPDFPFDPSPPGSKWAIVLDCETDAVVHGEAQPVLVVPYQVYEGAKLRLKGFAYDPIALYPEELETLRTYSIEAALPEPIDLDDFRSRFFRYAYDFRATVVGFHLAYDLPKLAHDHAEATRRFYGGFTLWIAKDMRYPPIHMKKLNARAYRFRFGAPRRRRGKQLTTKKKPAPWRGSFVDLKPAGDSLLGGRYDLERLAKALNVARKLKKPDFKRPFGRDFLEYAYRDVVVTSACYFKLTEQFDELDLPKTLDKIYSEASVAKAEYMRIGVRPWLSVQPWQANLQSLLS